LIDEEPESSEKTIFALNESNAGPPVRPRSPAPREPAWRSQIAAISQVRPITMNQAWPAKRQIVYIVDVRRSATANGVVIAVETREPKADGSWKRNKALQMNLSQIEQLPLAEDREIIATLAGGKQYYGYGSVDGYYERMPESCAMRHSLAARLMPIITATG